MTTGIICDVKRFAVHDGPGIRTTLFLKGCPLHCVWCHNPETIRAVPELAYRPEKCVGCEACSAVCEQYCHSGFWEKGHVFSRERCTACGKCAAVCFYGALTFYGETVTVAEAFHRLIDDCEFFEESGGGVTLSGGEPLLQPKFTLELLKKLHDSGVSTALDTCGCVAWENLEAVLPFTDLFLYDFKHSDSTKHKRYTGSGNELIKDNLKKLGKTGKQIEIRIPLIPGVNTDEKNLDDTGKFLAEVGNICAVRLLPYHSLARSKYAALGVPDSMPDAETPNNAALHRMAETLNRHGLKTVCPND